MLSDLVIEKVFCSKLAQQVPVGYQYMMMDVFREVLENIKEEKPDATLSDLFE